MDFYLAQIALVLAQVHSKRGREYRLRDFLLRFTTKEPRKRTKLTPQQRMKRSKAFWLSALGIKQEKSDA